jgi:6-pyruvoyltetrahydropterin/6-carboxytetrahydropterin synthase
MWRQRFLKSAASGRVYTARVFRLSREVRFALPPSPGAGWCCEGDNSFGGKPPVAGFGAYLTLTAVIEGEPQPGSGYLRNIKEVDVALRDRALPMLAAAVRQDRFGDGSRPLVAIYGELKDAFPGNPLTSLTLGLSPLMRVRVGREEPTMVHLTQTFEFAAGHRLHNPGLSDEENRRLFGKCNNPHGHGHNYIVEVTASAEPDPTTGFVINVYDLEKIVDEHVITPLDHKNLDVEVEEFRNGLISSVENISMAVYKRLKPHLPTLSAVKVWETPKTYCEYSD